MALWIGFREKEVVGEFDSFSMEIVILSIILLISLFLSSQIVSLHIYCWHEKRSHQKFCLTAKDFCLICVFCTAYHFQSIASKTFLWGDGQKYKTLTKEFQKPIKIDKFCIHFIRMRVYSFIIRFVYCLQQFGFERNTQPFFTNINLSRLWCDCVTIHATGFKWKNHAERERIRMKFSSVLLILKVSY